ncbi:MAG: immunoglobulin domain-containing protein [Verrucomicrobiae bacterium]|nr:immunoglobulin domain-containing protein [Verrucomicrobiae bacterium]
MKKLAAVLIGAQVSLSALHANLLLNPSFESGSGTTAANWTKYNAANREPWANRTGNWGMSLQWWVGQFGGFYQDVAGLPGYTYNLSAWFLDDAFSVWTSQYSMKLEWFDSTGTNMIGQVTTNVTPYVTSTEWRQLTLSATAPAGTHFVRVVFEGDQMISGETLKIDDVELTATAPPGVPVITNHPAHITVSPGGNATFTVGVSNVAGASFQWQRNGVNLTNGGPISGATSQTLTITGVTPALVGHYRVWVSNVSGSAVSEAGTLQIVALHILPVVRIEGNVGDTNIVEYASVLNTNVWVPFATNVLSTSPQYVVDPTSPGPNQRFYRVRYYKP